MTNLSTPVPNLVQGISQQPDATRFATQLEAQENAYSSPVDGLTKRHPTRHIARLLETDKVPDALTHLIDRDALERYLVRVGQKNVEVWGIDGTPYPVHAPVSAGAPYTADFDYLDFRQANPVTDPETFDDTADWVLGSGGEIPATSTTIRGPLGWGNYMRLANGVANSPQGRWVQEVGTIFDGPQQVRCYIRTDDPAGLEPDTDAGSVRLRIFDFDAAVNVIATFTITGGVPTLDSVTAGATAGVVQDPDATGDYLLWLQADPDDVAGIVAGNRRDVYFDVQDWDAVEERDIYAWGYRIVDGSSLVPTFGQYTHPLTNARAQTVADFTFVTNAKKTTAMGAATTASDSPAGHAFLFVRQGALLTDYRVRIKIGATDETIVVATWDGTAYVNRCSGAEGADQISCEAEPNGIWVDGTSFTGIVQSASTEIIAAEIAKQLDAVSGVSVETQGAVIEIQHSTAIDNLEVTDSLGDTALIKIHQEVPLLNDLPLICQHGFKIKINGEPEEGSGDAVPYYVEFVADDGAGFGNGHWEETVDYDTPFEFDAATLPHQLVRRQDDAAGTVTGDPLSIYFEWGEVDWNDRDVGDETSNPDPSFIGNSIRDITFHRGRLAFLSDDNVIYSETNRFFNFWRTTTLALVDADPIDIQASHTKVSLFHHAAPVAKNLVLFSEFSEFLQTGEPLLTPKSAAMVPVLELESLVDPDPVVVGRRVLFAYKTGDFSGVNEMFQIGDSEIFDYEDATAQVPKYISGEITEMAVSRNENVLLVRANGDRTRLWVHKYLWSSSPSQAQKIQSAWSRYSFQEPVASIGFIRATAYLTLARADGLYLESTEISDGLTDPDSTMLVRLDRKVSDEDLAVAPTYDGVSNTTMFTLPYDLRSGATMRVVSRSTDVDTEDPVVFQVTGTDTTTPGAHTVSVLGDHTATPVWIGEEYLMEVTFSKPRLRETSGRSQGIIATGYLQVLSGSIVYDRSGFFQVQVTNPGSDAFVSEVNAQVIGGPDDHLVSGTHEFLIQAPSETVTVKILSQSHLPCNILSAEWETDYTADSARFRG